MDKTTIELQFEIEARNYGREYRVKGIWDSAIYAREFEGHLLDFYYLVFWKSYSEEENTWEPTLVVQHLCKLISIFYKNHSEKPIVTSPPVNTALSIARPTIRPETQATQQKRG